MKTNSILLIVLFTGIFSVRAQDWNTNFEEAKTKASDENRNIILVFQGSDWCAPCIKLNKEIWNTEVFKAYAKDHFIMLQADFPRKKKNQLSKKQMDHNTKLAEQYNKKGFFPFVIVLDEEGRVLGQTGYKKSTVEAYIELLNSYKN